MMDSWISGELKKGDLIVAVFNNYLELGFYLGKGGGMSEQYYSTGRLSQWLTYVEKCKEDGVPYKAPYKSYMSNANSYRFMKYSPELIIEEGMLEQYNRAITAIKLLNI